MASLLKTNTAVRVCVGPFFDKTDGVTPETGLTVANCKITLIAETDDNSAPTIILDNVAGNDGTNTLAHITNDDAGYYELKLTAANLNRLGRAKLAILDAANHCPVFHEYEIVPANVYDSFRLGTDYLLVDAAQISGDGTAADNAELMFDGTGYAGGTTPLNVNVLQISADATAADNAELWFDGTAIADSVPADGTRPTPAQALLMITRFLFEASVAGTTLTAKKEDGSTASMTFTLNSATVPTSITRAT
jgi:hypothetical protein